jgi:hypothetical protein
VQAPAERAVPSSPPPQPATSRWDDDDVLFCGGRRWRIWRRGCPGLVATAVTTPWRHSWPEGMGSTSLARSAVAWHRYLAHLCPAASILNQASRCRDQAALRARIKRPTASILNPALLSHARPASILKFLSRLALVPLFFLYIPESCSTSYPTVTGYRFVLNLVQLLVIHQPWIEALLVIQWNNPSSMLANSACYQPKLHKHMPCIRENRNLIAIQVKDLLPTEKLYMMAAYRKTRGALFSQLQVFCKHTEQYGGNLHHI